MNVHGTAILNSNETHQHLLSLENHFFYKNKTTNLTFFAFIAIGCGALFVWLLIIQWTTFFTIYSASIVHTIAFSDLQVAKYSLEIKTFDLLLRIKYFGFDHFDLYVLHHRYIAFLVAHVRCNQDVHQS